MKPYERRELAAYPYFKLATWDARNIVWKDGRAVFPTEDAARVSARVVGRYRVSRIEEGGRSDLEPFHVRPFRSRANA